MKKTFIIFILIFSVTFISSPKALADTKKIVKVLKQTGGVVSGFTISPFIGGFRGFLKGWQTGTNFGAEFLGDEEGSVQKAISFMPGGFIGGFGGGAYGLLMGAHDGITYGISNPFSKENFSLTGNSLLDYELL